MKLGPNQLALINLWRTTTFGQTTGKLRSDDNCFCCLGLAVNHVNPHDWVRIDDMEYEGDSWGQDESTMVMSDEATEYFGFRTSEGNVAKSNPTDLKSCTGMNDDLGYTFKEIADVVEANPEAYFMASK